jgi:PTS system mannose-specific IIB component/fructoselysine and glucoselysine-specific PTS system IIB component
MSWLLHRVDDRLVHGQVVLAWGEALHPRRMWIADDSCAANDWERELIMSAAPDMDVRVVTVEEAARCHAEEAAASGGAFLLLRDLQSALRLVDAGAAVQSLNVGGLHYAPGKDKLNEYVYLNDDDRNAARALLAHGVQLAVQDVPATRSQSLTALDKTLSA